MAEITTATIAFAEYPGEEIVVRLAPVPMRLFFEIMAEHGTASTVGQWTELFRKFIDAGLLVSWTFPEPCDLSGFLERDIKLGQAIIGQWIEGVRNVPLPLPVSASGGTPSTPEASQPSSRSRKRPKS